MGDPDPDALDLQAVGKIGRVIQQYGLPDVPTELATRWRGDGDERWSLRALADYVNERILAAALADAGADTHSLSGDVSTQYRVLTGEAGSAGDQATLRARLTRAGVDVDALTSDFVSHQTVHTFLTDHLDEHYEVDDSARLSKDAARVSRLESRLEAVASDAVERSARGGRLEIGDAELFVETRVLCTDCGESTTIQDLFERGHCGCSRASSTRTDGP